MTIDELYYKEDLSVRSYNICRFSKEAFFWFKFTEVPQIEIKTDHEFHKQYYQSLCW